MRRRRLSQLELGAALGLSHTSIGRWLGGSVPHKRTAAQLAEYFGVSVEDLLEDGRELPGAELPPEVGGEAAEVRPAVGGDARLDLILEKLVELQESQEAQRREIEQLKMAMLGLEKGKRVDRQVG